MPEDPAPFPRSRSFGGRLPLVMLVVGTLLGVPSLLWWQSAAPPVPTRGSSSMAAFTPPPVIVPVSADAPAPASTAANAVTGPPTLPVSNAFTTMADYRHRRATMPRPPDPLAPLPAGRTPETELGRVTFMVRDYRMAFGENPVGTNREITRALLGDNARGTKFIDPATVSLDARGNLLDAWGRPYFFHSLSGKVMEIRSAGPDGKIFTADDLVR